MTKEEKQRQLQQRKEMILATIDYLLSVEGGSLIYDGYDPLVEYYQQQKLQTEKYFNQRRLDRLQQQFSRLLQSLKNRIDLTFASYIKEKTGHDVDIFEDVRKRVDAILAQKEIQNQKDLHDVGVMLRFYLETQGEKETIEALTKLLREYSKHQKHIRKSGYSEVVSSVVSGDVETVTIRHSTGPKPKHFEEHEAISPNGKNRLRVTQWSDGKHSLTYVTIVFPSSSGCIYGTDGIRPTIKAWWKDNSTIVVETEKEYPVNTRYHQVRSFNDAITIEYIEHE